MSTVAYDAAGGNRATTRYGAGSMLGSIVSHKNIAVDLLDTNDLQMRLKNWVQMEDYSLGPNDCGQVIIKSHTDIQHYLGKKKRFTPEYVDGFFRKDALSTGLAPTEFQPFLEEHRMSLHVIGIDGKVLYSWTPEGAGMTRNKKCRSVLYLLAHNRHYWELNANLNSLEQKVRNLEKPLKQPVPYYATPSNEKTLPYFARNAADIEAIIAKTQREELVKKAKQSIVWHNVHYDGDAEELFVRFLRHHDYEAEVQVSNYNITGMSMIINDRGYNVKGYKKEGEKVLAFGSEDIYEIAVKEMFRFQSGLMNEGTKSRYHPTVVEAFAEYRMGGLKKCLMEGTEGSFCAGFDVVRAYSGMLLSMETLPVLSRFDEFMDIVGPVLDDSFYLVENEVGGVRHNILMNRRYGLLQGYVLNRCGCVFRLIAELRPSRLAPNPTRRLMSALYKNHALPYALKKDIPNIIIGQMTRRENRHERYMFFQDCAEAVEICGEDNVRPTHYGFIGCRDKMTTKLVEGWLPVGLAIYHRMRLKLLEGYDALKAAGRRVIGFRTDMIQCDPVVPTDLDVVQGKKLVDIGHWRIEGQRDVPGQPLCHEENKLVV